MKEQMSKILKHPWAVPVFIGGTAFSSGLGLGYILFKRKTIVLHSVPEPLDMDIHTDELAEIRKAKEVHPTNSSALMHKPIAEQTYLELDSPALVVEEPGKENLAEKIKEAMTTHHDEPEPDVVRHQIFARSNEEWDYEKEQEKRTGNLELPYILHRDEFFGEEMDFTQVTLTYYAGDDIMADEDNSPIYNHEQIVGPLNFGHGSSDPNVVYVRNEKRRCEYEILYDSGLFSAEVLGLEIENNARVQDIKHSHNRKFKQE